jgi:hypothetical protein
MEKLHVTVVGKNIFQLVEKKFELVGINNAKMVKTGMLGNLKILAYEFELEESEVIDVRKRLMSKMAEDSLRLMPMYVHGDWMRIFVFEPIVV